MDYPLPPSGVRNSVNPPGEPTPRYKPRHRKLPSDEEVQRLRAMGSLRSAPMSISFWAPQASCVTSICAGCSPCQRMTPELFVRSVERAHRYHITSLEDS
ncbi:MAG: hypothetical protein U1G07_08915 [Verrucomicrobiota bacterium]